jgi:hypothetical protein
MPGFMPGIHVFAKARRRKAWMAGTSPAMTKWKDAPLHSTARGGSAIFACVYADADA